MIHRPLIAGFALCLALWLNSANATEKYVNLDPTHSKISERIIAEANKDNSAWDRLAYFCDTFGPRLSGSDNLDRSLDWIEQQLISDGFDKVWRNEVYITNWRRNDESLYMAEPRKAKMEMLGLGGSIATPKGGITAPVLVVSNFDELEKRASEAKGKIVVYNYEYESYGQAVQYRTHGAERAARHGALASLIRSVSPVGYNIPHTGMMVYSDSITKIPHAAITMEDAKMLKRMQDRGQNPILKLVMNAETLPDAKSCNLMAEIRGSEFPDQIISLGGHIDSWDTGTGAHDDAGGCFMTWEAVKTLIELGIRPKRTIRVVFWVNEENGIKGAKDYAQDHKDENHYLLFESDSGIFPPSHVGIKGSSDIFEKVKKMEPYFKMVADELEVKEGAWGVDIRPLAEQNNVPMMNITTQDEGKYFWYHHSPTDTVDKIDPKVLNTCISLVAIAMYLYSDI